jgi:hypothetical protein
MNADTPIVLAVAEYPDRDTALIDYDAVRSAKRRGDYDHLAVAVMTKKADGSVQVERHDSSAKHLAWGGALLGGALIVTAPVAAPIAMATSIGAGGGVTGAGLAGAGGIAGHFWHNIPKERIREMSDLLEAGESGLVVVAVDKKGSDIEQLLGHATRKMVDDTTKGDLEAAYNEALTSADA